GLFHQPVERPAHAIPLEHGELGVVPPPGLAVAEHAAELVAVPHAFGQQPLHRVLGGGAQPPRARRAVGAPAELDAEGRDVGIGVAGARHHRRLHLQHAARVEELAHEAVQARAQAQRLQAPAVAARGARTYACPSRKASSRGSSQNSMPSPVALASFEPASAPATTKPVLRDTLPATLAPSASSRALASSRPIDSRVPVRTTVTPSSGPADASPSGSAARSPACAAAAAWSRRALPASASQ